MDEATRLFKAARKIERASRRREKNKERNQAKLLSKKRKGPRGRNNICPWCFGIMTWCSCCEMFSSNCCQDYGTCMCS